MRVVVAMSGGVDSSLAAALAKEAGHEVIGMSLQLWDHARTSESRFGTCCSPDDLYDARRVCEQLDIPFYVVNAEKSFREKVVDAFIETYLEAETPNPCVHCNDTVKFDRLIELADQVGADMLVTGHYARKLERPDGTFGLAKAVDRGKDQTYFLHRLDQSRLARVLFPLGEMTKDLVREAAMARGLPTASKHDSQELCFVPENDYARFLEEEGAKATPGAIVDLNGRVLGRHTGLFRYTIGQRRGLGISSAEPLYVVGLDKTANQVVVGPDTALFRDRLLVRDVTWIRGLPDLSQDIAGRIRYRSKESPVQLIPLDEGRYEVRFAEAQRAPTPGQALVFYQEDEVLGGGWIERTLQPIDASPAQYAV